MAPNNRSGSSSPTVKPSIFGRPPFDRRLSVEPKRATRRLSCGPKAPAQEEFCELLDRFFQNWVYAAPPCALLLVTLYPFVGTTVELSVYLSLPAYMIHQYEEHDDNRFAVFLNTIMGKDRRGLTPRDVWVINVIFVWFFLLAVFYMARANPGWGVLAGYLLAINGFVHIAWAVKFRAYNPGLWTAIALFIPGAIWIFLAVPASLTIHAASALLVVALHAAIMALARRIA
ncbi:MAG: HXXEE domain-containing protein [Pseudomonadota bacterium]